MLGNEFLTTIYAYGNYFTICEKVDAFNYREVESSLYDYYENGTIQDATNYNVDDMPHIQNIIEVLETELGETSDNCQIGRSLFDGRVVSYDFGYESGSNSYSVSDQLDYIYRFFEGTNMLFGYLLNEVNTDYGFIADRFNADFDEYYNEDNYDDVEEEFQDEEEEEEFDDDAAAVGFVANDNTIAVGFEANVGENVAEIN